MHNAPSVSYPVGRSFWAGVLLGAAWTLGALCVGWWTLQFSPAGWRTVAAWLACLAAGAWAALAWSRGPVGELHWAGAAWRWTGPDGNATDGELQAGVDLQRLLLVRWKSCDGVAWFWLERGSAPVHWAALRRAVYSPAKPDGLQGAQPPSAIP